MSNRSIAWWLRQIGLSQYTKTLESEYYGLEGLLNVTDGELKDAGIDDAGHRETILTQLSRHRQKLDPHTSVETGPTVRRKYSLGSSVDLVKLRKDLFRQSVLPRLQRTDKKHRLSASCSQLRPLDDAALSMKDSNKCSHPILYAETHSHTNDQEPFGVQYPPRGRFTHHANMHGLQTEPTRRALE